MFELDPEVEKEIRQTGYNTALRGGKQEDCPYTIRHTAREDVPRVVACISAWMQGFRR